MANVHIKDNKFYILVDNKDVVNQLTEDQTYANLVACFETIGYNYNIVVMYKPTDEQIKLDKLNDLEKILGCKITIKD